MRTAWMCAVLVACGSSGGTVDGGADTGTDAQPSLDAGLDSAADGSHKAPPSCTTLGTLPMRTPTYFVDFSAGNDASDGKSQGTAFKHAPGDANATGNAASVTLAPGDVVLLKGGVEYDGTITSRRAARPRRPSCSRAVRSKVGGRGRPSSTVRRHAPSASPSRTRRT